MKIISFPLWGNNSLYTIGAIKNVDLAKIIYPDWTCRFYVDQLVPFSILNILESKGAEVIRINEIGDRSFSLYRFLPLSEKNVEMVMSRDTDSRLNYREKGATEEWIKSEKKFLILRDHPYHKFPILAGLWNCKGGIFKNILEIISTIEKKNEYLIDFYFLMQHILTNISKDDILEYDEIFMNNPFSYARNKENFSYFVGEIYNERDEYNIEHRRILEDWLKVNKK